jgi:hypothetical protein
MCGGFTFAADFARAAGYRHLQHLIEPAATSAA